MQYYSRPVYRDADFERARSVAGLSQARTRLLKTALTAFAFILIGRLFMLQVLEADFYRALASDQRDIYQDIFPVRGEILIKDLRENSLTPLATNKDLFLVFADPRLIDNPAQVASDIAPILGIERGANSESPTNLRISNPQLADADKYQELINRLSKSDDPYEPLKSGVEEDIMEQIKALEIRGIDAVREAVRFYPLGKSGAHISGFVGFEGDRRLGRYGIEGVFESELAGQAGSFSGERDAGGRWIPVGRRELKPAVDGATVVLTLDRTIQYTACTKLEEAVARHGASGGAVVILEVKTGAVLAMCGAPTFDPNNYAGVEDISVYNNPATSAQYEPGSVFKVITMASALDAGEVTPETTYEDKGVVQIGSYDIRNSDNKAHGVQTMTQVLEESLNTGAIFAANKVGLEKFRDYVERFGFGKATGVGMGSEAHGDIAALQKRGQIYLATSSFGQGISATPMQMASAVSAIANQGKLMKPYLVEELRESSGASTKFSPETIREVITPRAATLLSGMMVSVVENGHGKRAGVPGYFVAGKTGTAQIPLQDDKGYESGETIGTFVGFAPVENPKFAMLTRIDRPKDVKFAESTAAPLFGDIAKFLLQYFEIKPTRAAIVR